MRILFLGDIVGKSGREVVLQHLPLIKRDHEIAFTIANAENSAHGKGITKKIYDTLIKAGIDCLTGGNHSFSKADIIPYLDQTDKLLAPINHAMGLGQGYKLFEVEGFRFGICNILGEVFMNEATASPFKVMEELIAKEKGIRWIVDLHGEATSEKELFAHYFKDHLLATIGTHTHVQTADERLIGNGTYISDAGMCGAYDSIIGRDIEEMKEALKGHPTRYTVAEGKAILSGIIITIDPLEQKATAIERIQIRPESSL